MRLLTVLNFSAGKQSTCLLEMVLRKEIEIPRHFVVLNADPGMENSKSYQVVSEMRTRCKEAGIHFETVKGPNLLKDLLALKDGTAKRIDNPPYWTKSGDGNIGRLMQKCTKVYKIAPMDRAIRRILYERFRIKKRTVRIPVGTVEKWIGFSADEASRIKPPQSPYQVFRYPLIEMGMGGKEINEYYRSRGIKIPERSVCNGCFANGLRTFKQMRDERPSDFAQAVAIDETIRHGMKSCGVNDEVYVSSTCIPLTQLAQADFKLDDAREYEKHSCTTGYCFT